MPGIVSRRSFWQLPHASRPDSKKMSRPVLRAVRCASERVEAHVKAWGDVGSSRSSATGALEGSAAGALGGALARGVYGGRASPGCTAGADDLGAGGGVTVRGACATLGEVARFVAVEDPVRLLPPEYE